MKERKRIQGDQSGVALVLMVAVMALVVALSTSILLASSQLNAAATRAARQEQARIAAQSLDAVLQERLNAKDVTSGVSGDLVAYLYQNMTVFGNGNPWTYYNAQEAGHTGQSSLTRSFSATPAGMDGLTAVISMYWESDRASISGSLTDPEQKQARFSSVKLHVSIKCTMGDESYVVASAYGITCSTSGWSGQNVKGEWTLQGHE